uniref:Uncharacterized protein n=1 Tax=Helianthus annuus TaxID=4232 RepID=A0A1Y3BXN5_HELAN
MIQLFSTIPSTFLHSPYTLENLCDWSEHKRKPTRDWGRRRRHSPEPGFTSGLTRFVRKNALVHSVSQSLLMRYFARNCKRNHCE